MKLNVPMFTGILFLLLAIDNQENASGLIYGIAAAVFIAFATRR